MCSSDLRAPQAFAAAHGGLAVGVRFGEFGDEPARDAAGPLAVDATVGGVDDRRFGAGASNRDIGQAAFFLEAGVFPSQRALDEGGLASLEEERRLAYVAITRARTRATILHAANRRIYGQWTSSIPSRFVAELPADHIETETTMTGGESLWRAQWSEQSDPFAHVARPERRGPGMQRALTPAYGVQGPGRSSSRSPQESKSSAVSLGNKGRSDVALGMRVFHAKFGYGTIAVIEGNKLEIDFEHAGRKRVMDSFISLG